MVPYQRLPESPQIKTKSFLIAEKRIPVNSALQLFFNSDSISRGNTAKGGTRLFKINLTGFQHEINGNALES